MKFALTLPLLLCACASNQKCGTPEGAKVVYAGTKTCTVRIRQVVVGSELNIPESLKGPALLSHELEWVDSGMTDGKIQFGHFVLIPQSAGGSK